MPVIAIPYVPMPADQNPNVKSGRADTYMVSSIVTLASLRRWNPNLELRFVSDRYPEAEWPGRLRDLRVDIDIVPFDHKPPPGFANKFMGSLYLLDVLERVEADYLCVIDPDVFCIGSLDNVLDNESRILALNIPSSRTKPINGLAPDQADVIHARLGEDRIVDFHYGGEFYGIPAAYRAALNSRIARGWGDALEAWSSGEPYFTTEEHILNFAFAPYAVADADSFVRRIWTAYSYRTVKGDEHNLLLWHLPSEKERGFRRLLRPVLDSNSWFWEAPVDQFAREASRVFSLRGRMPLRLALDTVGRAKRTVTKLGQ